MNSKRCSCGASYDAAAWRTLAFVGWQVFPADGDLPEVRFELRNCSAERGDGQPCDSTLALREGVLNNNMEAA